METVSDVYAQPVSASAQQIVLDVPQDASMEVMQSSEAGKLYLCDGFTVAVQILEGGDLNRTLQTVTGYPKDALPLMQTKQEMLKRYECVFTSAGEGQTQVGRTCVLDDGDHHYTVTVMAGESLAGELTETWKTLFDSFRLVSADADLSSGS